MSRFWTGAEKKRLEQADTLSELADIALVILGRMAEEKRKIVQICGPMTTGGFGNLDDNMKLFQYAIDVASDRGLHVFNQLPFQDAMKRIVQWFPNQPYCQAILDNFYRPIFGSGYVQRTLFLPNWKTSHGASWEYGLVTELGLVVQEYPVEWLTAARIVAVIGGHA